MAWRKLYESLDQANKIFKNLHLPLAQARVIMIKAGFFFKNIDSELDQFLDCLPDLLMALPTLEKGFS